MMDERNEIPQRRLSDEARARRRTELMEGVAEDEPGAGRGHWWAPVAAAAAVAVVGGGVYLAAGTGDDGGRPPAEQQSSLQVAASGSATASVRPTEVEETCEPAAMPDIKGPSPLESKELAPSLRSYRTILAEHLDPKDQHLDPTITNVQTGSAPGCGITALGTKLGWTVPGQDGKGMVQVEVVDLADGRMLTQVHLAHRGWRKVPVAGLPGAVVAYAVEYDGGAAVAVTREDGLTVAIDADHLFGNNATVPVRGFELTVDDLLEAAADPGFQMP